MLALDRPWDMYRTAIHTSCDCRGSAIIGRSEGEGEVDQVGP